MTDNRQDFDVFQTIETAVQPDIVPNPRSADYLERIGWQYKIPASDLQELNEYIAAESSRLFIERFSRLLAFFKRCRIPRLVVFYVLATQHEIAGSENLDMVQIARICGCSKQAIHKAFRSMEPEFRRLGRFFTRKRNFKNPQSPTAHVKKVNGHKHHNFRSESVV